MHNKRNKYDKRDCLEIGQKAEGVSARIAARRGWKVTAVSNYANINDHMESPKNDNLYFRADSVYIYHDDFLTTEWVEENSIDLIVTSPPYNVDIAPVWG